MILCSSCQHKEMVGALFCSQCGTQLILVGNQKATSPSAPVKPAEMPISAEAKVISNSRPFVEGRTDFQEILAGQPKSDLPTYPSASVDASISLSLLDTGDILPLVGHEEITLGRASEGQSIIPDVDLGPHRAYDYGVSRLHATLRSRDGQIQVIDLGSANGTWVNGQKIPAYTPTRLVHGDLLVLGRFKIQVMIR